MITRMRCHLLGWLLVSLTLGACSQAHHAPILSAALPPPPEPAVRHSSRIWLDLGAGVQATQCVTPESKRQLCFRDVDYALARALEGALWTSFPAVQRLGRFDAAAEGDYVLRLELGVEPLPPGANGPGWAAAARGRWQLLRDGRVIVGENLESRSRADFAYGSALAAGAAEVLDAVAIHVAGSVNGLPESRPVPSRPLPPVIAEPWQPPGRTVAAK